VEIQRQRGGGVTSNYTWKRLWRQISNNC